MPDAQFPSDAEEDNGDQPRRAGLKLRDAETVATTRRDMFGDGSLLDALAGSPPAPRGSQSPPEFPPPEAGLPESGAPGQQPLSEPPADGAAPRTEAEASQPGAESTSDHREDAIGEPRFANPASSPFVQVPQSLDSIIDSFVAAEPSSPSTEPPAPEPPAPGFAPPSPGAAPAPKAVSSIFDGLGAAEPPDPAGEALPFGTSSPDIPMPAPPPEAGRSEAPWPGDDLPRASGEDGESVHGLNGDPRLGGGAVDAPGEEASSVPRFPVVSGSPSLEPPARFREPPARFREPPARFHEPPEVAAGLLPAEPVPSGPFHEPGEAMGVPRYPEPPPMQAYPEPFETPSYPQPTENALQYPGPATLRDFASPGEDPSRPMFDGAAKIEAEANATAEALDHLKRLLAQNVPGVEQPVRPPGTDNAPYNLLGDPTQFAVNQRAPLLPLPVPNERASIKGIYLLGFLTGLGLSLMAGVALYFLINMG
jgi:hypothetical protein